MPPEALFQNPELIYRLLGYRPMAVAPDMANVLAAISGGGGVPGADNLAGLLPSQQGRPQQKLVGPGAAVRSPTAPRFSSFNRGFA